MKVFGVKKLYAKLREPWLNFGLEGFPIHSPRDVAAKVGDAVLWVFPAVVQVTNKHENLPPSQQTSRRQSVRTKCKLPGFGEQGNHFIVTQVENVYLNRK